MLLNEGLYTMSLRVYTLTSTTSEETRALVDITVVTARRCIGSHEVIVCFP